jgi:hypothetical protein
MHKSQMTCVGEGGYVGAPDGVPDKVGAGGTLPFVQGKQAPLDPTGNSARWRPPDQVPDLVGAGGVNATGTWRPA